jgi:hypothetical protein
MQFNVDNNGNKFFQFKNVRVSVKHAKAEKDWEGTKRYLQILAYRDSTRTGTFPGPQIPIDDTRLDDEEVLISVWHVLKGAT